MERHSGFNLLFVITDHATRISCPWSMYKIRVIFQEILNMRLYLQKGLISRSVQESLPASKAQSPATFEGGKLGTSGSVGVPPVFCRLERHDTRRHEAPKGPSLDSFCGHF